MRHSLVFNLSCFSQSPSILMHIHKSVLIAMSLLGGLFGCRKDVPRNELMRNDQTAKIEPNPKVKQNENFDSIGQAIKRHKYEKLKNQKQSSSRNNGMGNQAEVELSEKHLDEGSNVDVIGTNGASEKNKEGENANPEVAIDKLEIIDDKEPDGNSVELSLHYNPVIYDPRPRVKVTFLSHGQGIGYSLLLDTGAGGTSILRATGTPEELAALASAPPSYLALDSEPVSRPAKWNEGYLDACDAVRIGGNEIITFGSSNMLCDMHVHSTIQEQAMLFAGRERFSFPTDIALFSKVDYGNLGSGLLGADPTSRFAEASGVFAYIGPAVNYYGNYEDPAGRLLIGERQSWDTFCADDGRVMFFSTLSQIERQHYDWLVKGSVTVQGTESSVNTVTALLIDTGAVDSHVTTDVLNHVRARMVAGGARLVRPLTSRQFEEYQSCPTSEKLPTVTFRLGGGPDSVNVPLVPDEYIYRKEDGNCYLKLSDHQTTDGDKIIGMTILSKIMTVFDRSNNRLGFCITRQ